MRCPSVRCSARLPADSGDVGIDALVPGSYGAYRINPDWAIGFAINAPFGLATKADTPWAGQNYAIIVEGHGHRGRR